MSCKLISKSSPIFKWTGELNGYIIQEDIQNPTKKMFNNIIH